MKFLLLLLLLIPQLVSATENVVIDDDANPAVNFNAASSCASNCNTDTDCEALIDNSPDSPDDNIITHTGLLAITQQQFATPSDDPTTGTNDQTIRILMTRMTSSCAESGGGPNDPAFSLSMRCGATTLSTPWSNEPITGLDTLFSATWTFNTTDCADNGSDVHITLTLTRQGSGGTTRFAGVEAIEWVATVGAGIRRSIIIGK